MRNLKSKWYLLPEPRDTLLIFAAAVVLSFRAVGDASHVVRRQEELVGTGAGVGHRVLRFAVAVRVLVDARDGLQQAQMRASAVVSAAWVRVR